MIDYGYSRGRASLLAGACATALVSASAARAQTTEDAEVLNAELPAAEVQAADEFVGEIVVSAQHRDERLSKVPISISAYTGEQLQRMGATDMADISRATPGFHVVPGATIGGGANVSIRGISTTQGAATIGIYIDDVPVQGRANNWTQPINPGLFDMERVEVLRGPQGTLYGASSQGGTLRFITVAPSLTYWSGHALGEVSANERGGIGYQTGLAVGGPLITDKIGVRAAVNFHQTPGYVDRVSRPAGAVLDENINDITNFTGRLAATFAPIENLEITPQVYYQRLHGDDLGMIWDNGAVWPTTGKYQNREERLTPYTDETVIASLTADYEVGPVVLTSITAWRDRDLKRTDDYSVLAAYALFRANTPGFMAANPNYASPQHTNSKQKAFTQEVRLSTIDQLAPVYGTLGLFYSSTTQFLSQFEYAPATVSGGYAYPPSFYLLPGGPLLPNNQKFNVEVPAGPAGTPGILADKYQREYDQQISAFADATWNATPRLKVSAGARVAKQNYEFQYIANGFFSGGVQNLPKTDTTSVVINPKVSVAFQATDRDLFYASASRGQRPGGANRPIPADRCAVDIAQVGSVPQTYTDDTVWAYEVGTKNRFFGDALSINASLFYLKWNDIQQNLVLSNCNFSYVGNFGSATSKGFDVSAQIHPVRSITIGANLGYTDATLDDDVVGSENATTRVAPVLATKGSELALVPKWTADVNVEWTHELDRNGTSLFMRADYQYQGAFRRTPGPGSILYNPITYAGQSYDTVNLKVGVDRENWRATIFANNVTNSYPTLFLGDFAGKSGFLNYRTTLAPRTYGLNVTHKW